jgi:hypothetical protein
MSAARWALAALGLACGAPMAPAQGGPAEPEATRWIERCLRAQGAEALPGLNSVEIDESGEAPGLGAIESRGIVSRDGSFYLSVATHGQGTLTRAFDGQVAWQKNDPLGTGFIAPRERTAIRSHISVLIGGAALKDFPTRRILGYVNDSAGPGVQIEMAPAEGPRQVWTLSQQTALIMRIEHVTSQFGSDSTFSYGDYRRAGPLTAPFSFTISRGDARYVFRRTRIEVDRPLDPSVFAPPTGLVEEAGFIAALVHRHLTHEGGLDALAAITSKVIHERQENESSGVSEEITCYIARDAPNRILEVRRMPGMGTSAIGFDGREGWMSSDIEGNRGLDRDEVARLLGDANLRGDADLGERYPLRRYLGVREIDGRKTYAVQFSGFYQRAAVFFFDPETYRVVRIGSAKVGSRENNIEATIDFADFRRVQGIEFPYRVTTSNPAFRTVVTVDSIELGVPIPKSTFEPRDYAGAPP